FGIVAGGAVGIVAVLRTVSRIAGLGIVDRRRAGRCRGRYATLIALLRPAGIAATIVAAVRIAAASIVLPIAVAALLAVAVMTIIPIVAATAVLPIAVTIIPVTIVAAMAVMTIAAEEEAHTAIVAIAMVTAAPGIATPMMVAVMTETMAPIVVIAKGRACIVMAAIPPIRARTAPLVVMPSTGDPILPAPGILPVINRSAIPGAAPIDGAIPNRVAPIFVRATRTIAITAAAVVETDGIGHTDTDAEVRSRLGRRAQTGRSAQQRGRSNAYAENGFHSGSPEIEKRLIAKSYNVGTSLNAP